MKTGTMPKQGDILLIPIPFTDLSSQKRRPVIVISNDQYNRKTSDVMVVAVTSNPQVTDYSLSITSSDLIEGTLNRPGKIRVDKDLHLISNHRRQNFRPGRRPDTQSDTP